MKFITVALALVAMPLGAQTPSVQAQTPEHIALADQLVEASGAGKLMDTMLSGMTDAMMPMLIRGNEARGGELRIILREEFATSFAKKRGAMIAIGRDSWATNFSDAELRDLIAFYRTPTGQKLVSLQPKIATASMTAGQQVGRAAAEDAVPRIMQRMKAAGLKAPSKP